jgi:hypothetical protein
MESQKYIFIFLTHLIPFIKSFEDEALPVCSLHEYKEVSKIGLTSAALNASAKLISTLSHETGHVLAAQHLFNSKSSRIKIGKEIESTTTHYPYILNSQNYPANKAITRYMNLAELGALNCPVNKFLLSPASIMVTKESLIPSLKLPCITITGFNLGQGQAYSVINAQYLSHKDFNRIYRIPFSIGNTYYPIIKRIIPSQVNLPWNVKCKKSLHLLAGPLAGITGICFSLKALSAYNYYQEQKQDINQAINFGLQQPALTPVLTNVYQAFFAAASFNMISNNIFNLVDDHGKQSDGYRILRCLGYHDTTIHKMFSSKCLIAAEIATLYYLSYRYLHSCWKSNIHPRALT